jgi:hypothetical protein
VLWHSQLLGVGRVGKWSQFEFRPGTLRWLFAEQMNTKTKTDLLNEIRGCISLIIEMNTLYFWIQVDLCPPVGAKASEAELQCFEEEKVLFKDKCHSLLSSEACGEAGNNKCILFLFYSLSFVCSTYSLSNF